MANVNTTRKEFAKLRIGALFIAHGCLWSKTAGDAAYCIGGPNHYGSCNFTRDPADAFVEEVDGDQAATLLIGVVA